MIDTGPSRPDSLSGESARYGARPMSEASIALPPGTGLPSATVNVIFSVTPG